MKTVQILGPGCKRCEATAELIKSEAAKLGVEVSVSKVTDYAEIAALGVIATPGVVIDGKVVHAGGLPRVEDIDAWLRPSSGSAA